MTLTFIESGAPAPTAATTPASVVVYDPAALIAEATRWVIERRVRIAVAGVASTYADAFELLRRHAPSAFVFSCPWQHPTAAASFIKGLRVAFPAVSLVLVTGRTDRAFLGAALRAGTHATLHRRESTLQLTLALEAVGEGRCYRSPVVVRTMTRRRQVRRSHEADDALHAAAPAAGPARGDEVPGVA